MLNILEKLLIAEVDAYQRLDNSTPPSQRLAACETINGTTDTFVFLLSTRAGGLGLNLTAVITAANKVVVFDPNWNPSYDIQAQDRAFRIGQRRHVSVYRVVSGDSSARSVKTCPCVSLLSCPSLTSSPGRQAQWSASFSLPSSCCSHVLIVNKTSLSLSHTCTYTHTHVPTYKRVDTLTLAHTIA